MAAFSVVPTLARRFLLSKASDKFLSFIAWVSVVGVALGVLALVVVTSVINGFENELSRVITGMYGDVVLYTRADPVKDVDRIEARIRQVLPSTQAIAETFATELMAAGPGGVAGAVLEGMNPETIGKATSIPERVVQGRLPAAETELAVGSAIAEKIGAKLGSEIRLIIPFTGGEDGGEATSSKVIKGTVVGIIQMGMYDYDSKFVFGLLPAVQKLLNQPGRVTTFKIRLAPGADSLAASTALTDSFGFPFRAKSWAQLNKNLFYAIQLEKAVIAIILAVIVIVAAFNVVSTLMMMIHDKTKEIAILKAMGLKPAESFRLFCIVGVGMGAVGTGAGVGLGILLNWVLEKTHLVTLPADIYYIGFLPVIVRWNEVLMIGLAAIAISFVATLYPAFRVSRRSPLDGLRYE